MLGVPAAGLAVLFLRGGWRPGMAVTTPYGLWTAVLLASLYVCFAMAATLPLRPAVTGRVAAGSAPAMDGVPVAGNSP